MPSVYISMRGYMKLKCVSRALLKGYEMIISCARWTPLSAYKRAAAKPVVFIFSPCVVLLCDARAIMIIISDSQACTYADCVVHRGPQHEHARSNAFSRSRPLAYLRQRFAPTGLTAVCSIGKFK